MSSLSPPWEAWALDQEFFGALIRWTITHPESTLDRVLDNICVGIDKGQDIIDCIPEGLFPARSLVEALGRLVKLGTVGLLIIHRAGHAKYQGHCRVSGRQKETYKSLPKAS
jgi:hypothetical protein